MGKIFLILSREFAVRVRKRSFIVLTLLTPILFAALMVTPALLALMEDPQERRIAVIDKSGLFHGRLPNTETIRFSYLEGVSVSDLRHTFRDAGYYGVLLIAPIVSFSPDGVILYSHAHPPIELTQHIASSIRREVEAQKLQSFQIEGLDRILASIQTPIRVRTIKWAGDGEAREGYTELAMGVSYLLSVMMYALILLFGSQVMRGVAEEKSSRIVEVLMVSAVKPFQLMMGKILGIASVALLQIFLWIALTFALVSGSSLALMAYRPEVPQAQAVSGLMDQQEGVTQASHALPVGLTADGVLQALSGMNFALIIGGFIFFFVAGYLLYAALFAAVGSAADSETDSQLLVTPITVPLVLALIVTIGGIRSPDSPLAFWFSIFPLTSPVAMTTRLPFGVPTWELLLSGGLLMASFVGTTWLAGRVYRTGILLYGKKASWRELWRWARYR